MTFYFCFDTFHDLSNVQGNICQPLFSLLRISSKSLGGAWGAWHVTHDQVKPLVGLSLFDYLDLRPAAGLREASALFPEMALTCWLFFRP